VALGLNGKPLTGETSITFLIFKGQQGGESLFTETQMVVLEATGHYKAQLGATYPHGLPFDLFSTGEARWLEVQIAGEKPQPRVLLASVPYALKAADAATLGGLPASAFALAGPVAATNAPPQATSTITRDDATPVTTTGGTAGYVPMFSGASTIVNANILQGVNGIGIGPGLTGAATTLDVNGASTLRGDTTILRTGNPTASAATNSYQLIFSAGAFSSTTNGLVKPSLQWRAEPKGNNTASPSATLNLLSSNGTAPAAETGFFINPNGTLNFAPGQTFPGTGAGTITGVTAGTALTGGGTSGNVTLNLDTAKVPLLAANNTFTVDQAITGNLSVSGTAGAGIVNAATAFDLGGSLFAFGSQARQSVYLGFAGNSSTTGNANTVIGSNALFSNTTGSANTASGEYALTNNTMGNSNTATGANALFSNTTGGMNTASGLRTLYQNTMGANNTASGSSALFGNTTGSLNVGVGVSAGQTADGSFITGNGNTAVGAITAFGTGSITNATAIGYLAEVTQSNTMVLGCTLGVNSCQNSISVGIGTTTPDSLLTVNGTADKPGGGSWGTYSDGRLKTVNGSFGEGLGQVMQLRPVRYRYKPDNAMGIRDADEPIGVVAQEVQRVIPEAVTENGKGYLLVNNDPILWSMVNAIKEQQREIEEQRKLIRVQSAAMRNLAAEVRETRKALRQVKAQAATVGVTMVAAR
jgi:hypothetical protein